MMSGELRRIGNYELRETIGHGGMAAVYKAYQSSLDRVVAIKVISSHLATEPEFIQRFKQEAQAVARLTHPNIVIVHDFGEEAGVPFLVMEYVDGATLADLMEEGMEPTQIVNLMTQVAAGLDFAHSRGIVHRDIKPQNVMVTREGRAVLADFGLARMMESAQRLTMSGGIVGTPEYMSPEQAAGKPVDHRTDIYALGVILYEMVAGLRPFTAETPLGVLMKHLQERPPRVREVRPDLPEALDDLIERALAKKPEDRYQTAGDLVQAYRDVVSGVHVPAPAAQPTAPAASATPATPAAAERAAPSAPPPAGAAPAEPPQIDLSKYGVRPTAERATDVHATPSMIKPVAGQPPGARDAHAAPRSTSPQVQRCPNCQAEIPQGVSVCPNCMYMLPFEEVASRPVRAAPERKQVRVNLLPYNFSWDPTGLARARQVTQNTVNELARQGWELVTPLEAAGTFVQGRTARGPVVQSAILTLQRTVSG